MKRAPHIPLTEKQFRRQKRKQFQALEAALDELALGAGFLSVAALGELHEVENAAARLKKFLRKWWKGY
jgi:hypothetical protein